jgi:hypothetical protein
MRARKRSPRHDESARYASNFQSMFQNHTGGGKSPMKRATSTQNETIRTRIADIIFCGEEQSPFGDKSLGPPLPSSLKFPSFHTSTNCTEHQNRGLSTVKT